MNPGSPTPEAVLLNAHYNPLQDLVSGISGTAGLGSTVAWVGAVVRVRSLGTSTCQKIRKELKKKKKDIGVSAQNILDHKLCSHGSQDPEFESLYPL